MWRWPRAYVCIHVCVCVCACGGACGCGATRVLFVCSWFVYSVFGFVGGLYYLLFVTLSSSSSLLLAQLSRHRGGPVPPPARRWRPCCFGCPPGLVFGVFRRVERRSLSGSSPCFSVASPLLSARCARAGRSAPCARCSGTVPPPNRALRLRAPAALHPAAPCTAHWDRLSTPRLQSARLPLPLPLLSTLPSRPSIIRHQHQPRPRRRTEAL